MGEENNLNLGKVYVYFNPNPGDENSQWSVARLNSLDIRSSIEVEELDTALLEADGSTNKAGNTWSIGAESTRTFTFTLQTECNEGFQRIARAMKKHQRGLRHYHSKLMTGTWKKAMRKRYLCIKKRMFRKK